MGAIFDIIHTEAVAQSVNRDVEAAAAIAEELAPAARFLDFAIAAAMDRRASAGDDDYAVLIAEGGGEAAFAVSAGGDLGGGPNRGSEGGEFFGPGKGPTAREEDADVRGLGRKRTQEGLKVCLLNKPIVGGGEATLLEEGGVTVGGNLEEDPVGLGAAAFDAEDVFRCRSG